jgi:hypothetical protein
MIGVGARSLGSVCCCGAIAAAAVLAAAWGITLQAETPPSTTKAPFVRPLPAAGSAKSEEGGKRLREGTRLIDVEGRFEFTGDRMAFFLADAEESYKLLENLALERINKVLEETRASEKPQWIVSGTITEYHGGNYLLVTKAVIKAQAGAAAPPLRAGDSQAQPQVPQTTVEGKAGQP